MIIVPRIKVPGVRSLDRLRAEYPLTVKLLYDDYDQYVAYDYNFRHLRAGDVFLFARPEIFTPNLYLAVETWSTDYNQVNCVRLYRHNISILHGEKRV